MLEIKNITKTYKTEGFTQKALDKVSINFRRCEFTSILGPSGSGKTTLLNIIGGLDHYDSGDLIINGTSTKKYNDRDWDTYRNHRVGFVFQSYNLITHQTVLANVELALALSGIDKKERTRRAKEALAKVGLKDHMKKKPSQLSGGQMQRVAIARALVNDPEIVLADEPTGALDTATSRQVMELLKEIAKDRLVIMVTHNAEIAEDYSTRIIRVQDGEVISDTNPYKDEEEKEDLKKDKKTSMNFLTAFSLSLNNLMTKKGRTILTAFAGSIGIIGIALILSLAHGINKFIDKTEEETLSSYPLQIQKASINYGEVIKALAGNMQTEKHNDDKIYSYNIMGSMFESFSASARIQDMSKFKAYLEKNKEIDKYVTSIQYGYNTTLTLYKPGEEVLRVNPTTVLDSIGMGTNGISNVYSGMMSDNDVFYEMIDNDKLIKKQYNLVAGKYPKNYNEVMLLVDENNQVPDYTLYSLGILSQDTLKEQFNNMISGKEVKFEKVSYKPDEIIGLKYKLVINPDFYQKVNNVWINKSDDTEYMKKIINESEEIEIVGIVKQNSEAVSSNTKVGSVLYKNSLMKHLVEKVNEREIVKEQISNKEINVFTGNAFRENNKFDMNSLSYEQMMTMQNMSESELAEYIKAYSENATATYEDNLLKLGISEIDNPDTINIYPKDFDSKEKITKIIEKYNKGKKESDKIEYNDIVGIMMSSVQTIVNVISTVLIAFVAISLIVSSIMIAIITYISVIERTKEIGILRAVGASKKDISRVFNAETLIEGLAAGILGIVVTILFNIPINIIVKAIVNISGIASLPISGAIILIIISVLLTVIAGFIPAKIASRKDPVEALRSE